MTTLQDRKVVVIGGSGGMGLATAERVIDLGGEVAIAALPDSRLDQATDLLSERASRPVASKGLRVEDRPAVAEFLRQQAPFDHLVLPGSTVHPDEFETLDEEVARAAFDSKFWGPFWAAYEGRHHLRRGGSVVFFTGPDTRPVRGYRMVMCIDAALNAATRFMALDVSGGGLRVNAICPGFIRTPLFEAVHTPQDAEERLREWQQRLPVGRVGQADEIAQTVVYLLTNDFVTGQVITVDGGQAVTEWGRSTDYRTEST